MDKAGATTNPHEAEAFSRKAAELIARHRIDPAALTEAAGDDLTLREVALGRGAYVRARLSLLMAVAEAHDCRVVFASRPEGTIAYVAGYRSDLDVVEVLYHSLHAQAASRMARERRATGAATQRYRRSFLFGFAEQVHTLLADTRRSVEAEPDAGAMGGVDALALARRERFERVDEYLGRRFDRIRSARTSAGSEPQAWLEGNAAAAGADIGHTKLDGRRALGTG